MPVSCEYWEESRWLVPSQHSTTISPYHWWTENCWWPRGILKSPLQTVVSAQLDELPREHLVMMYLWACTVNLQIPFVSVSSDFCRSPRAVIGTLFLWMRKWGAQGSRRTKCDEAGSLHCGWPSFCWFCSDWQHGFLCALVSVFALAALLKLLAFPPTFLAKFPLIVSSRSEMSTYLWVLW